MATFITTNDPARRRLWTNLFGTTVLPVVSAEPKTAVFRGGPALVYTLDVGALHAGQIQRLAGYVARHERIPYNEALTALRADGWPITAADCHVVETAVNEANGAKWPKMAQ